MDVASPEKEEPEVSPKELLRQKAPKTDMEKVACLAFYLGHYRHTPHFKTIDISKVNTDAAQTKFSNTAYTVGNATKRGLLVLAAKKGYKQLGVHGEEFVKALPDREKAKAALKKIRPRRQNRKSRDKASK